LMERRSVVPSPSKNQGADREWLSIRKNPVFSFPASGQNAL
jgi:hypothetical protein